MGIFLTRLPEYGLNLTVYRGKVDRAEFVGFYSGMDGEDPANRGAWVTYLAPDLDFSTVDCTAFPQVKRILKPIVETLRRTGGFRSALVSDTPETDLTADFWRDFVGADPEYPSHPEVFSDVHDALDWLEVPRSAYDAVMRAVTGAAPKAGTGADPEAGRPDLR